MATINGAHHVAFTVRDVERSVAWYSDLLGMQQVLSVDTDDAKIRVLAHPASGWLLGLREYSAPEAAEFSEFRTGLDHFAFAVDSKEELSAWEGELESRSIPFTPTTESPIGTLIAFR